MTCIQHPGTPSSASVSAADRQRLHRLARARAQALRAQAGAEVWATLRAGWSGVVRRLLGAVIRHQPRGEV
jgi:hypothetical protein